jgi:hypothetical protein
METVVDITVKKGCNKRSLDVNAEKRTEDVRLPSGSIIHWSERDGKRVPVTCGRCQRKHLTSIPKGQAKQGWPGICKGCGRKKKWDDEILATGSVIHWAEFDPSNRRHKRHWVTCGKCREKRLIYLPRTEILLGQYTGYCVECATPQRLIPIKRISDEPHISGAIIHWSKRPQGNLKKVAFTCAGCSELSFAQCTTVRSPNWTGLCESCRRNRKRISPRKFTQTVTHWSGTIIHGAEREPGKSSKIKITCYSCREDSYAWHSWIKDEKWDGRCHSCVLQQGKSHPRKRTKDVRLPSGSIIHWSERAGKHVPITCAACDQRWSASIAAVRTILSRHRRQNQNWPGYCPDHHRNIAALSSLLIEQAKQGEAIRTTQVISKRRPGPQKGSHATITEEAFRRSFKELGSYATQEEVAEFLNVTDRGIRDWQKQQGLKWREVQQRFS